jgi:hypothetical protein
MTDQHRAKPEQLSMSVYPGDIAADPRKVADAINALSARIEALEAAQQDKLDRLIALDAADPTPDPAMAELRARVEALEADQRYQFRSATEKVPTTRLYSYSVGPAKPLDELGQGHTLVSPEPASAEARPAWRPLDIETTYGSEAAADAAQILHASMVVEGTFEHGGETYRFKAKPEREAPMSELHAASAEARPVGGLVERVRRVIGDDAPCSHSNARAAIRELAAWLRDNDRADLAQWLEQEASQ